MQKYAPKTTTKKFIDSQFKKKIQNKTKVYKYVSFAQLYICIDIAYKQNGTHL